MIEDHDLLINDVLSTARSYGDTGCNLTYGNTEQRYNEFRAECGVY